MPRRKTHEQFLEEIKDRNFVVKKGKYIGSDIHLTFKCKKCSCSWDAKPQDICRGHGCPKCGNALQKTHEQFLEEIRDRNFEVIDGYYFNSRTKLKFKCKKCEGEWWAIASVALHNSGCPKCRASKGELKISSWLDQNSIKYQNQKKFSGCKMSRLLRFDFFLPELNTCIEFDGAQHFTFIKNFWGRSDRNSLKYLKEFVEQIIRDESKDKFCKDNNIKLIRIPYYEIKNISEILRNQFFPQEN